jgi:hypothetical protein
MAAWALASLEPDVAWFYQGTLRDDLAYNADIVAVPGVGVFGAIYDGLHFSRVNTFWCHMPRMPRP